jgi:hypothetical protein
MTLRDDLIPVVDEMRELVDDLGLRRNTVETRLRTWSGGELGLGTPTDVDTELDPKPKVAEPSPWLLESSGGKYESGDLIVSRISATYDEDDLTGGTLAAAAEWFVLIDGDPYRVVSAATERNFEWRLHVRRITGR